MKFTELRQKTAKELDTLFLATKKDLADFRRKTTSGELKNVRAIRKARILVAQILTLRKQPK